MVGGVPWRVNGDDPKADGEAMKMDIPPEARQATELEKEVMAQAPIPRNFYITKEHLYQVRLQSGLPWMQIVVEGGRRGKLTTQHAGEDLRGKLLMIRRSGEPSKSRTTSSPRRWKKKKREGRDHGWQMIMNQSYLRPHQ